MNVAQLIKTLQETPNPSATTVQRTAVAPLEAAGDFTGGTPEDKFTLAAHGLVDGDVIQLLYESAAGVVNGALGDTFIVKRTDANVFQLTSDGSTVVENSADGTAVFYKRQPFAASLSGSESGGIDLEDGGTISLG